jgi:hypothetical protein
MARLIAYDRIIESAVALPGALDAPGDARPEWRVTVEAVEDAPPFAPECVWRDAQLVWSINPAEQHVVTDRHLALRHRSEADARSVSENAIANGLPALAWIAGNVVMHAAAVVMPGADSATVLNELMQAGASLLADDTLVLRREGNRWIGSGLAGGWFMRTNNGSDRAFSIAPAERRLRRAAIGAFICLSLEKAEVAESAVQRINGIAAISALLNHRHRALVAGAIGSQSANLATFAEVAATVPIVNMPRQWGCIPFTDAELAAIAGLANHRS